MHTYYERLNRDCDETLYQIVADAVPYRCIVTGRHG